MNPQEQLEQIRRDATDALGRLRASIPSLLSDLFPPQPTGDFIEQSRQRATIGRAANTRRLALILLASLMVPVFMVVVPYRGYDEPVTIIIESGLGRRAIARRLTDEGVLMWRWPFLLYSALRPGSTLKAGEYRFDGARSAAGVFGQLSDGRVLLHTLTVPEGWSQWEIADEVARLGLVERDAFLRAAAKTDLVSDIAPGAETLEGYLYPDTYRIARPTTAEAIVRQMVNRFRRVLRDLPLRTGPGELTLHEIVTLASMVEKESGIRDERGLIAGVYRNRLREEMRLGCDPTVIYAALLADGGEYDGVIHQSDLDRRSPYNTYLVYGLPPGPIASPGRAALAAAVDPAETDYLYFVADARGGHTFAKNVGEHSRNVRRYRELLAQQ